MRTMRMMTWAVAVTVGLMGVAMAGAQDDLAMGEAIELPHAGVTISLPEALVRQANLSPYQLVGGTMTDADGELLANVSLLAYPTHPDATAEEVGDNVIAQLSQDLAFRNVEELGTEPVTMAGLEGQSQLVTYTHRGRERLAVNVCAVRYYEPANINLCYVLKIEAPAGEAQQIADVAKPVLASMTLDAITPTVAMPVGELGSAVTMDEWGYAVSPPLTWCVSTDVDSGSIYMGLMDHTLGGEIMPAVLVVAAEIDAEATAETCVADFIEWAQTNADTTGTEVEVLCQTESMLDQVAGQQVVLLQRVPLTEVAPDESADATDAPADTAEPDVAPDDAAEPEVAPEADGEPCETPTDEAGVELDPEIVEEHLDNDLLVVYRVICVPAQGHAPARSYSLTLICDLEDGEAASAFLDDVAEGFSLIAEPTEGSVEDTCHCTEACCQNHVHPADEPAE